MTFLRVLGTTFRGGYDLFFPAMHDGLTGTGTWGTSDARLAGALLPEQWPVAGSSGACPFGLKQVCLGACRNGGHEPVRWLAAGSDALRLAWRSAEDSAGDSPLAGLEALLRQVVDSAAPLCSHLTFAGDSVSHDSFLAAMAGGMKLGLRLQRCTLGAGGSPQRPHGNATSRLAQWDNATLCQAPTGGAQPTSAIHSVAHFELPSTWQTTARNAHAHGTQRDGNAGGGTSSSEGSVGSDGGGPAALSGEGGAACSRLSIYHAPLAELRADRSRIAWRLLGGGRTSTVIINEGLWANRASELTELLETNVRPLLSALARMPAARRANLLWRETTPQHFAGRSHTGLFAERTGTAATSAANVAMPACAPVLLSSADHVRKANWRNRQFDRWSRPWRVRLSAHSTGRRTTAPAASTSAPVARSGTSDTLGRKGSQTRRSTHAGRLLSPRASPRAEHSTTDSVAPRSLSVVERSARGDARGNSSHPSSAAWGSALVGSARPHSLFEIAPCFNALLPRSDLHLPPDCTHFCYTPLVWAPVWIALADALNLVVRGRGG